MVIGKGIKVKNAFKYPLFWNFLRTFRATDNYFIAQPGWYRFHVIGAGGRGGDGGRAMTANNRTGLATGSGGSSASSGAYSIHELYLKYGEVANIVIDGTQSKLTVSGSEILAKNGVKGYTGAELLNNVASEKYAGPVYAAPVTEVVSSGGNVENFGGIAGEGSQVEIGWEGSWRMGGKANSNNNQKAIYTTKGSYSGATPMSDIILGGAGAGGIAASTFSTSWVNGNPGYNGGFGGVVIERGAYA